MQSDLHHLEWLPRKVLSAFPQEARSNRWRCWCGIAEAARGPHADSDATGEGGRRRTETGDTEVRDYEAEGRWQWGRAIRHQRNRFGGKSNRNDRRDCCLSDTRSITHQNKLCETRAQSAKYRREPTLVEVHPKSGIRRSQRCPISLSSSSLNTDVRCFQDDYDYWKKEICYRHRFLLVGSDCLQLSSYPVRKTVYYRCCTFLPFWSPVLCPQAGPEPGSCAAGNNADASVTDDAN